MPAAFVVEDGTGLVNANSFASVAGADQYFLDRNIVTWTGADDLKQSALVRATDYINNRFRFKGVTLTLTQALEFPRDDVGMPTKLLYATYEYALRALTATLAPDPVVDETGGKVISKTETVGPLSEAVTYESGVAIALFKPYPAADVLLRGLLAPSGRVIRA